MPPRQNQYVIHQNIINKKGNNMTKKIKWIAISPEHKDDSGVIRQVIEYGGEWKLRKIEDGHESIVSFETFNRMGFPQRIMIDGIVYDTSTKTIFDDKSPDKTKSRKISEKTLAKKAEYIARNHRTFYKIAIKAKEEWRSKGKSVKGVMSTGASTDCFHWDFDAVEAAVKEYVLSHPEEIIEMERLSRARCKIRKKLGLGPKDSVGF